MKCVKVCSFVHYLIDTDGYKCYKCFTARCVGRLSQKKANALAVKLGGPTAVFVGVDYAKQEITIADEIVNEHAIFADYATATNESED